jgi:hypothetical protein
MVDSTTSSANITISVVPTTTTDTATATVTLLSDQAECTLFGKLHGFNCCKNAPNPDWKDKNGYLYGWENDQACIEPKSG